MSRSLSVEGALLRTKARTVASHRIKPLVKRLFRQVGIEPRQLNVGVRRLWNEGVSGLAGKAVQVGARCYRGSGRLRRFVFDRCGCSVVVAGLPCKKDDLDDLFAFVPKGKVSSRSFLRYAHNRLCAGEHVFTYVEGGCLMGVAWFRQYPYSNTLELADSSRNYLVHNLYLHPQAHHSCACNAILHSILADLHSAREDGPLCLWVRDTERDLTVALERLQNAAPQY